MEEKIEVLFAHSFLSPKIIVVQEVTQIGEFEFDEVVIGNKYDDDTESWIARNDISYSIRVISKSSLKELTEKYTNFIESSWEKPCNQEKTKKLKEEFLSSVQKNN